MSMASIDLVFVSLRAFWRASLLKQLLGAAVLVGPGDVDDFLGRLYAAFAQPKPNDGGDTREHHGAAVIGGNASVAQCESAMPCALFEQLPDDLLHAVANLHIRSVTGEGGELAIVLGTSGAGKSTVLNILGGVDTCDKGQVIIDGADIAQCNAQGLTQSRRSDVGFVFQFYNLVPNLTAKENVELESEIVADAMGLVELRHSRSHGDR